MIHETESDDVPQLSAETFAVLQEFYREQDEKLAQDVKGGTVEENWQLSQFWYDEETINVLAEVAIKIAGTNGKIALVSCPSLYKKIKERCGICTQVTLFEYDKRFSIHGSDFVFYDYNHPTDLPENHKKQYNIVLADPPFLSEECLTKTTETIKLLAKDKIILCTGAVMADLAEKLLNLKKSSFEPKHTNNLANEFWCYTNFNADPLLPT